MSPDTIDNLLVQWELARQSGREIGVAELCAEHPELKDEVGGRIAKLRATSWMLDSALLGESAATIETTKADASLTITQFVDSVQQSGVLSDADNEQIKSAAEPLGEGSAEQLATSLVQRGLLTTYQANVLLQREEGPLLLDRYVILDTVGSGGMGLVFKALHRPMERIVALKVLPRSVYGSPALREGNEAANEIARFKREIKATASLSHPHIVTAYDAHESNGTYFLVMEYVDGVNAWDQVQQEGPLPVTKAVRIGEQIASALAEAHEQGIIHRDIKPPNILIAKSGDAKLLDLGIARVRSGVDDRVSELTGGGLAMGTVPFMSPEQALDSRSADARSDIYSLGCSLFYLLTGKPPFDRETCVQTIVAHREETPPSLRDYRNDIPEQLDVLLQQMLAKDPAQRVDSMAQVRQRLAGLADDRQSGRPGVVIVKSQAKSSGSKSSGINRRWLVAGIGLIAIAFVAIWGRSWFSDKPDKQDLDREVAAWALRAGGTVEVKTKDGTLELIDESELPQSDITIVGLDLTTAIVDNIERAVRIRNLKRLKAAYSYVDANTVQSIVELPLTELALKGCTLRDKELSLIAGMTQLRELDVSDNDIGDNGVAHLSRLKNLTTLSLGGTELSDAGLEYVLKIPTLQRLDLSDTSIAGTSIPKLKGLPALSAMDLGGLTISPAVARSLAEMSNLRLLQLDHCKIGDAAVAELAKLPKLRMLYLEKTQLTGVGLQAIGHMKSLKHLDISNCAIPAASVAKLKAMSNLESLALVGFKLNSEYMQAITSIQHLQALDLSETNLNDQMARQLGNLKQLTTLIVEETAVTDSGIERLETQLPDCTIIE